MEETLKALLMVVLVEEQMVVLVMDQPEVLKLVEDLALKRKELSAGQ